MNRFQRTRQLHKPNLKKRNVATSENLHNFLCGLKIALSF